MADAGEPRVRVVITAPSADELRALLRDEELDLNCGGPAPTPAGEWTVEAYAPPEQIRRLSRRAGYALEVDDALAARVQARQEEVASGDRFRGGQTPPRGIGRKT
jgi:hypothetical protein